MVSKKEKQEKMVTIPKNVTTTYVLIASERDVMGKVDQMTIA
ncbi:MAG: hypothetical protein ACMUEM_07185 [Flavobacteriales bacterium AspAUS03]